MATSLLHRDTARKLTGRAKIASLVLLCGAPVLAIAPMGSFFGSAEPAPRPAPAHVDKPPVAVAIDLDRYGKALQALGPKIEPKPEPPDGPGPDGPGPDEPPPAPPPPAAQPVPARRFIGAIISPRGSRALIVENEQQKMLRVGDNWDADMKIKSIESDRLVIGDDASEDVIFIAPRTITWSNDAPSAPNPVAAAAGAGGNAGNKGGKSGGNSSPNPATAGATPNHSGGSQPQFPSGQPLAGGKPSSSKAPAKASAATDEVSDIPPEELLRIQEERRIREATVPPVRPNPLSTPKGAN